MATLKWVIDPKAEALLRRMGVKWTEEDVFVKDIDTEESLARQVRLGKKLDTDVVLQYALGMLAPDAAFPMPIVNKVKKYCFLWSGNHRIAACQEADIDKVKAYVVNITDPKIQDIIPRIVNALESPIGQKKDESLIHAAWVIKEHGVEPKEAARLFNVQHTAIVQHLRSIEVAETATAQGVSINGMSKSLLLKLSPLLDKTNVLKETVRFVKKHDLGFTEADRFIDDVKKTSTEADSLREIKKWEQVMEDRRSKKAAPFRTKNRSDFMRLITGFDKFLTPIKSASQLQLESGDEVLVARYWDKISTKMKALLTGGE